MTRVSVLVAALLCVAGAAPASAATLIAFQSGDRAFTYISNGPLTADVGGGFDANAAPNSCHAALGPCVAIGLDISPSFNGNRDVVALKVADPRGGMSSGFFTFAAGSLTNPGFYQSQVPNGTASLLVADIGDYAAGSVGYVFMNGGNAFAYVSPSLVTADVGDGFDANAAPTFCHARLGPCLGIGLDVSPSFNGNRDVVALKVADPRGGASSGFFTFAPGSLTSTGFFHAQAPNATASLQVFTLPGGITAGGVPEPAAWALMIAGLGLTGGALRRRRVLAAPARA